MIKFKRTIALFTLSAFLVMGAPKQAKALDPFSFWGIMKILGIVASVGTVWYAYQEVAAAEVVKNEQTILDLFNEKRYPLETGIALNVAKNDKGNPTGKVFFVSIVKGKYADEVVKTRMAETGVLGEYEGRLVIGVFSDPSSAQEFANVFNAMTDGEFRAVRTANPVLIDKVN